MPKTHDHHSHTEVALVFQGGGALGAFQAGVLEGLHRAGIEPDWVVGTSIGAIHAALVAGGPPQERMDRVDAFWDRMALPGLGGSPLAAWLPVKTVVVMLAFSGSPPAPVSGTSSV